MSNSQETIQFKDKTVKLTSSKISNSSTKSTSKFRNVGDFLWSKLTSSRKNSSLNISKSNSDAKLIQSTIKEVNSIIDTTSAKSEKKHRRNLFHIFDSSSSKLKLNTGVHKKNIKNKTATKKQIAKNEHEIVLEPEPQKRDSIQLQKDDYFIGSEIESIKVNLIDNSILKSKISAASKRNARNRPTSSRSSDLNSSCSNSYQTITLKSSLSKMSTSSLTQKMEVIDETDYEKVNEKQSSNSINFESENLDMSLQNKSDSNSSIKTDTKTNEFRESTEDLEKHKIAIYDNNITECSAYEDENNENNFDLFEPLPKEVKSKSYEKIDFIQSAKSSLDSNNNYDHLKNANNSNNNSNPRAFNYIKNNRYSYFDGNKMEKLDFGSVVLKPLSHSRSLKLNQKTADSSDKMPSSLTGENLNDKKLIDANFKFTIGQFSNSYKIPNSKKRDSIISKVSTNTNEEPVWKELAFKKHNAWNQKNIEPTSSQIVSNTPSGKSSQDKLDQVPIEGKVKSDRKSVV